MNHSIIIDHQKVHDLTPLHLTDDAGELRTIIHAEDADKILELWEGLSLSRRDHRYGTDDRGSVLITIWISGDALVVEELQPFWSPRHGTVNGYDLHELKNHLEEGALRWGEEIGEAAW